MIFPNRKVMNIMKCPCCGADIDALENGACPLCGGVITRNVVTISNIVPLKRTSKPKNSSKFVFITCRINNTDGYKLCGFDGRAEAEVTVPETYHDKPVLSIKKGAFRGTKSLQSIRLPSTLQIIEESAFDDCIYLSSVEFNGNHLSCIRENAFRGCIRLSPESSIFAARFVADVSAFAGCYRLPIISSGI